MMRIALLADIHGNLAALEAVISDLQHRNVQRIVNLGDHASGPLLPLDTARLLMAQDWIHLAGNHERQLLTLEPDAMGASDAYTYSQLGPSELAWMEQQKPCLRLDNDILLCHGTPADDSEYLLETVRDSGVFPASPEEARDRLGDTDAQVIACGHTHIPRCIRTTTGQLIINPGSVGLPAYDDVSPCYHVMQTGSPDARYGIIENRGSGWSSELIAIPYDHRSMAEIARGNGRLDWEQALLTGTLLGADDPADPI